MHANKPFTFIAISIISSSILVGCTTSSDSSTLKIMPAPDPISMGQVQCGQYVPTKTMNSSFSEMMTVFYGSAGRVSLNGPLFLFNQYNLYASPDDFYDDFFGTITSAGCTPKVVTIENSNGDVLENTATYDGSTNLVKTKSSAAINGVFQTNTYTTAGFIETLIGFCGESNDGSETYFATMTFAYDESNRLKNVNLNVPGACDIEDQEPLSLFWSYIYDDSNRPYLPSIITLSGLGDVDPYVQKNQYYTENNLLSKTIYLSTSQDVGDGEYNYLYEQGRLKYTRNSNDEELDAIYKYDNGVYVGQKITVLETTITYKNNLVDRIESQEGNAAKNHTQFFYE